MLDLWFLFYLLVLPSLSLQSSLYGKRDLAELSLGSLTNLATNHDPVAALDLSNPSSHLSKILIPRAAGTENNTLVKDYIVSTLKALDWDVEEDSFTDDTPIGKKTFTNVIATKDPEASRRLVLSAHFDSVWFPTYPKNQFLGATDSAASCAIMLDIAEALNGLLEERHERLLNGDEEDDDISDTTLQLVFFDGEEAFVKWSDTDSIYGARHLADKWSSTYIAPHSKRRLMNHHATELSTVEHLILLDLIGAPNPTLKSYFLDTAWLYDALVSAERRLGNSGLFVFDEDESMAWDSWTSWFRQRKDTDSNFGYIGDDHVPFLKKGVSILHLIVDPFPKVWHTQQDDASALDLATMRRWSLILRVLLSEYLNLRPSEDTVVERIVDEL